MKLVVKTAAAIAFVAAASPSFANEYADALQALATDTLSAIAADPAVVAAVRAQNERTADLSADEIDALDQDWRAQVSASASPLIDEVLSTEASQQLVAVRDESEGLFTEIFAMDAKGLNVAASDVTSDYWQGDEAKWQETYSVGADAVHISEIEFDESTQIYQSQVSLVVVDPDTNAPIGAITFGVDVEGLE